MRDNSQTLLEKAVWVGHHWQSHQRFVQITAPVILGNLILYLFKSHFPIGNCLFLLHFSAPHSVVGFMAVPVLCGITLSPVLLQSTWSTFFTIIRSHALVIFYFFPRSVSHFRCIQFHSRVPCCGTFYCHIMSIIVRVFSIDKVLILQRENLPIKYHLCYNRIRIWENCFQSTENSSTWSDWKAVFTVKMGFFLWN